jgi:hypothetical protein
LRPFPPLIHPRYCSTFAPSADCSAARRGTLSGLPNPVDCRGRFRWAGCSAGVAPTSTHSWPTRSEVNGPETPPADLWGVGRRNPDTRTDGDTNVILSLFDFPENALLETGEALAADGMALAAAHGGRDADRFEVRFLTALLASSDGTATTDDATSEAELLGRRPRGGRYVGATTNRLAVERIIQPLRSADGTRVYRRSRRPARHATPISVWRLLDAAAAARRVAALRAALHATGELFD